MNVLANNNELLKYIEIFNKIVNLHLAKRLHNRPVCKEYIKTKISPYNETFDGNKRLAKVEYYGHSILLTESICEVKNEYYTQTFLNKLVGCNFIEKHVDNNMYRLFKELVQIVDWSDNESNN